MSSQQLHPDNALGILTSQNVGQMRSSPANKMDHSSLHPESPTETFVLLDSGSHPVYGRTPRMGHDSMIHMEDSRLSLELLYNDARQDTPSPSTEVEPSVQRPASRQHRAMSPSQKSSTTNALRIHMDVDTTDLRSDWEALWSSDRNQQEPQPLESSYMTEFVHVQESECKSLRTKSENSLKKQQILSESHMEDNDKEVLVEKDDLNDQADESILEEGDDETILVTPQRLTLGRAEPHLISVKRDDETGQIPSNFTTTSSKSTMRSSTTLAASSPSPSLTRSFSFLSQQTIPRPASTTSATSVTAAVSGRSNLLSQETTASTLTEEPDELDASFIEEPSSEEKRSNHHHHFSHGRHQQSKNLHPKADMTFIPPSSAAYLSQFKPAPPDQLTPNQVVLYNSMLDFQSKIWFTYRKDIPRIEPSFYTSDAGWGCMMRTGQSLLAQGFLQALLGRPWRATTAQSESTKSVYKMILSWFVDEPERPYSIQNIAKCGLVLDKRIGEWFGPATVAHALLRLSQKHTNCPLALIVPMDGVIRTSEVMQAALSSTTPLQPSSVSSTGHNRQQASASTQDLSSSASSTTAGWKPVVVLMPVRFGLQKLKEQYGANLKRLFQLPQFLGIAGGRPGRSLYFLGNQGNELFYLDPHIVKPRVSTDEMNTFPVTSFHCTVVRSMEIHEMDPSMLLGFVITSKEDLDDLYTRYNELIDRKYDLVSFVRDAPSSSSSSSSDKTHAHSGPQSSSVSGGGTSTQGEKDVSSHTLSSPSPQPVGVYEYRYTSHVGDHAYDPETFSVHSLDSDEE
ncbi:Cysteine protease atg4c [Actinomortierella wolfii]|nr:Cysteine protease atg4c [Actinomortierella wolfii]